MMILSSLVEEEEPKLIRAIVYIQMLSDQTGKQNWRRQKQQRLDEPIEE